MAKKVTVPEEIMKTRKIKSSKIYRNQYDCIRSVFDYVEKLSSSEEAFSVAGYMSMYIMETVLNGEIEDKTVEDIMAECGCNEFAAMLIQSNLTLIKPFILETRRLTLIGEMSQQEKAKIKAMQTETIDIPEGVEFGEGVDDFEI